MPRLVLEAYRVAYAVVHYDQDGFEKIFRIILYSGVLA